MRVHWGNYANEQSWKYLGKFKYRITYVQVTTLKSAHRPNILGRHFALAFVAAGMTICAPYAVLADSEPGSAGAASAVDLTKEKPVAAPIPPTLEKELPEAAPVPEVPPTVGTPAEAIPSGQYQSQYQSGYPATEQPQFQAGYPPAGQFQPGYPPREPQYQPGYSSAGQYQPYTPSRYQPAYEPPTFQEPEYPRYSFQGQSPYPQPPYVRPGYYPSGSPDYEPAPGYQQNPYYRGGLTYVPTGLDIPISLRTSISTQVAKAGDFIEAAISSNVPLNGTGYIPAGSIVSGEITEAKAGRRLSRSGSLSIQFNELRLPNGASTPISAHLIGSIGRYKDVNGEMRGEGWKAKVGQFALRGLGGAGLGAALGTGLGAIVDGGGGAGTGAWAGAAFGGGLGATDMLLRKGREVIIPSGTEMKLQIDEPFSLPVDR